LGLRPNLGLTFRVYRKYLIIRSFPEKSGLSLRLRREGSGDRNPDAALATMPASIQQVFELKNGSSHTAFKVGTLLAYACL
jgi:hypothetical protein